MDFGGSPTDYGRFNSLALDSAGVPHISYVGVDSSGLSHLKYAVYHPYEPTPYWSLEEVDDSEGWTSLALDSDDKPHISYWNPSTLYYAHETAGHTWDLQAVDTDVAGPPNVIALDSVDRPSIFYKAHLTMKYARWTGAAWHFTTVVDHHVHWISLALDSKDKPHVCYYDWSFGGSVWHSTYDGTSWQPEQVDSELGYSDGYVSIAVDSSDSPHISYYDADSDLSTGLKYARWTGAGWDTQSVDTGNVGTYTSIALDYLDRPHISYFDWGSNVLRYARWTGSGWVFESVASVPEGWNCIAVYGSTVHISYYDGSAQDLWYATTAVPGFGYTEYFFSVNYLVWDSNGDGLNDAVTVQMDVDSTYPYTQKVHAWAFLYNPNGDVVDQDRTSWFITDSLPESAYCYLYAPPSSPAGLYDVLVLLYDNGYNWEDSDISSNVALYPPAITSHGVKTWYWAHDTNVDSVAVGDVDGDGQTEIITGGYYWDFAREVAQLAVWDGVTLNLEGVKSWYWTSHTHIYSVAVGDALGGSRAEIVTGGFYFDGKRNKAQLCVWDGATLALEDVRTWYWVSSTLIESVAVGDVDGDSSAEIVTGGGYYDGTRDNAQLCVWGI